jgi:hypothetical protein
MQASSLDSTFESRRLACLKDCRQPRGSPQPYHAISTDKSASRHNSCITARHENILPQYNDSSGHDPLLGHGQENEKGFDD